jgi:3-hydroxyisobutyrate dehydrogenase-like beta-hydroxyacid dehydrogenase
VERCRPVFATYAAPIVHLGDLGSGQLTKLLNNVLFTANLATAAGALALGRALDLDPGRLAEVISHGSGSSFALGSVARTGGTLELMAGHAGPLLRKDARLMADLAEAAGMPAGIVMTAADAALALMNHPR